MAGKIAVLDVDGRPSWPIRKTAAHCLIRRGCAREISRGVIQLLPDPKPLRAVDFMPRTDRSLPKVLPPAEVGGCIFEDPTQRSGTAFFLMAARQFCQNAG